MQIKYIDAHTHLQSFQYDADRDAVISRAREAGVRMINVGTQASTSRAAIELAEKHDDMWATIGFHPSHCNENWYHDADEQISPEQEIFDANVFLEMAKHPKVLAIGECGLDYYRISPIANRVSAEKQKEIFLRQVEIAAEVNKPLMIHCRDAFSDLISLLSIPDWRYPKPGIIHFFTGTLDDAKKLLDLGFSFTFGGAITFPPRKGQASGVYDEVIKMISIENILSETDAPYVAPASHRGERNEPAYVVEVVKKLAELKSLSKEEMAEQIRQNAKRIFKV